MYNKCYICCNGEIIRYGLSLVQLRLKYGCWHLFLSGTDKVALIWTLGQLEQNTVCRDRLGLVIEVAGTMYSKRYICCNGEILRYGPGWVQLRLEYGCRLLSTSGPYNMALVWTAAQPISGPDLTAGFGPVYCTYPGLIRPR